MKSRISFCLHNTSWLTLISLICMKKLKTHIEIQPPLTCEHYAAPRTEIAQRQYECRLGMYVVLGLSIRYTYLGLCCHLGALKQQRLKKLTEKTNRIIQPKKKQSGKPPQKFMTVNAVCYYCSWAKIATNVSIWSI